MHEEHRVSWAWEVRPHLALTDLVQSSFPTVLQMGTGGTKWGDLLNPPRNQEKLVLFLFYRPSYFPRS